MNVCNNFSVKFSKKKNLLPNLHSNLDYRFKSEDLIRYPLSRVLLINKTLKYLMFFELDF